MLSICLNDDEHQTVLSSIKSYRPTIAWHTQAINPPNVIFLPGRCQRIAMHISEMHAIQFCGKSLNRYMGNSFKWIELNSSERNGHLPLVELDPERISLLRTLQWQPARRISPSDTVSVNWIGFNLPDGLFKCIFCVSTDYWFQISFSRSDSGHRSGRTQTVAAAHGPLCVR